MRWPFVLRSRRDQDVAAAKAEADRLRSERDDARKLRNAFKAAATTGARQFAEADAANTRLTGRVTELTRRLEQQADDTDAAYAAQLEARIHVLTKGAGRYLNALWGARAEVVDMTAHVKKVNDDLIDMAKNVTAAERRARLAAIDSATAAMEAKRPIDGGTPVASSEEVRLRGELHRSEKARAALDEQCRGLQKINEVQARQLHDRSEEVTAP